MTYKRYPGSGTNLRPSDVEAMEWGRILWWYQWLNKQWEQEQAAIKPQTP